MKHLLAKLALLAAALLLTVTAAATQPEQPPPPDPADDPLPEGAKTRFGVTRPILRTGPAVAILAPRYEDFLAPTVANGVRRYHLGTGRPFEKVRRGMNEIGPGRVVASADGKRAVVVRAGTLTVVETRTGKLVLAVKPPEGVVLQGLSGASLSGDGKILAYGGRGADGKGVAVVWDIDKDEQLALIETERKPPVWPTISRDGKTVVTHGPTPPAPRIVLNPADAPKDPAPEPDPSRAAQVWEVESGKELFKAQVSGMGGTVVASAFSPDGGRVAVSAADGPVDVWDVKAGKRLHTLLGRKGQGVRVAFSADGKKVASIGPDYRTQMWQSDGKPLGVFEAPPGILISQISGFEFADNDRTVAWVTAAQFCNAWEAPSGRLLSPLMDHAAAIRTVAFPENEKDFFTSGSEGRVFRWDRPTGLLNEMITLRPARLPGQPPVRPVVNLSGDATRATWLRSPTEVFDMASGSDLFVAPPPSAQPGTLSFTLSPDGLKVIICSRQSEDRPTGACVVWDLVTQQRVVELEVPPSANAGPPIGAMSPDNSRLVIMTSRSVNGRDVLLVVGYDVKTGKKLAEVEDPAATGSMHLAVANDNTSAVLASTNGRVWAVDYANGKVGEEIDRLPTRGESAVYCPVAFSPDGKMLATGLLGDEPEVYGVRVYDWPRGKPLHTYMGHVGPVTTLRCSPDGKGLASGAQDTSVILWDLTKIQKKEEEKKEDKEKE